MKKSMTALTSCVTTISILFTGALSAQAAQPQSPKYSSSAVSSEQTKTQFASLEPSEVSQLLSAVELIDSIPESVLKSGSSGVLLWLERTAPEGASISSDFLPCVAALASAIASGALPIFKLTKIQALIKSLGGIWNTVRLIIQTGGQLDGIGGALGDLVGEISGIKSIWENCIA